MAYCANTNSALVHSYHLKLAFSFQAYNWSKSTKTLVAGIAKKANRSKKNKIQ